MSLLKNLKEKVTGAGQEAKTRPSCAGVVGKRKKSDIFQLRGVFVLTSPLMGDPMTYVFVYE